MIKLPRSYYDIEIDTEFPVYWKATDEQLESALYDSDAWDGSEENYCILTFADIKADFDSWTPEQRHEYLQDSDTPDYTVYDWIRDCMMNSLTVISGFHQSIPTTEVTFKGKSVEHVIVHRYGQNDYGVVFTDDPSNECAGCSVRGSLLGILDELKDEM